MKDFPGCSGAAGEAGLATSPQADGRPVKRRAVVNERTNIFLAMNEPPRYTVKRFDRLLAASGELAELDAGVLAVLDLVFRLALLAFLYLGEHIGVLESHDDRRAFLRLDRHGLGGLVDLGDRALDLDRFLRQGRERQGQHHDNRQARYKYLFHLFLTSQTTPTSRVFRIGRT